MSHQIPGTDARTYDAAADLTPRGVELFLRTSGWRRIRLEQHLRSIWLNEAADASLMLPLDPTFVDYRQRFEEALRTLSEVHHVSGEALALEVNSARSDVLLLRADQVTRDGTIPLQEAQRLLNGVNKMMLAAACSAIRPRASIKGRTPNAARDFVRDDVRMGHTLRGSFVITVFAYDDSVLNTAEDETEYEPANAGQPHSTAPGTPASAADASQSPGIPSFTRQVMSTLATGLQAASSLFRGSGEVTMDDAVRNGVSAELIDSLGDMGAAEGVRGLDMAFRWSPSQPAAPDLPRRVQLPREETNRAKVITEGLRRRPEIPQDALVGQVFRLERAQDVGEGVVIIDGNLGRTRRRVHVSLDGEQYRLALQAHDDRAPVLVTGTVSLEKRSWWMRGDVKITRATAIAPT